MRLPLILQRPLLHGGILLSMLGAGSALRAEVILRIYPPSITIQPGGSVTFTAELEDTEGPDGPLPEPELVWAFGIPDAVFTSYRGVFPPSLLKPLKSFSRLSDYAALSSPGQKVAVTARVRGSGTKGQATLFIDGPATALPFLFPDPQSVGEKASGKRPRETGAFEETKEEQDHATPDEGRSEKQARISMGHNRCSAPGCGMTFKWLSALRAHESIHTGEKPFLHLGIVFLVEEMTN